MSEPDGAGGPGGGADFDALYRDSRRVDGTPPATPWDIDAPQPIIEQLVAYGALRGRVLDPGTGPGHHAIYYAAHGHPVTGIDVSAGAIERARANAQRAGVAVDFRVADATDLAASGALGETERFDTVVDCAFYHVFADDPDRRRRYLSALHAVTNPGARLYMFEFGTHNVNGWVWAGLPAEHFRTELPAAGWRVNYLGQTTYQARFTADTFAAMAAAAPQADWRTRLAAVRARFDLLEPLLEHHRVHLPFQLVHATRA